MRKFGISLILSSYLASIMSRLLFCIKSNRLGRGVFNFITYNGKMSLIAF